MLELLGLRSGRLRVLQPRTKRPDSLEERLVLLGACAHVLRLDAEAAVDDERDCEPAQPRHVREEIDDHQNNSEVDAGVHDVVGPTTAAHPLHGATLRLLGLLVPVFLSHENGFLSSSPIKRRGPIWTAPFESRFHIYPKQLAITPANGEGPPAQGGRPYESHKA